MVTLEYLGVRRRAFECFGDVSNGDAVLSAPGRTEAWLETEQKARKTIARGKVLLPRDAKAPRSYLIAGAYVGILRTSGSDVFRMTGSRGWMCAVWGQDRFGRSRCQSLPKCDDAKFEVISGIVAIRCGRALVLPKRSGRSCGDSRELCPLQTGTPAQVLRASRSPR